MLCPIETGWRAATIWPFYITIKQNYFLLNWVINYCSTIFQIIIRILFLIKKFSGHSKSTNTHLALHLRIITKMIYEHECVAPCRAHTTSDQGTVCAFSVSARLSTLTALLTAPEKKHPSYCVKVCESLLLSIIVDTKQK